MKVVSVEKFKAYCEKCAKTCEELKHKALENINNTANIAAVAYFEQRESMYRYEIPGIIDSCVNEISESKEDKYRWHDLRKDPEDLPPEFVNVIVKFEYFRYGNYNRMYQDYGVSHTYRGEFLEVNGTSGWRDLKILAWKYIEPYEGGE